MLLLPLVGSYNAMVAFSVVFVLMDVHLKGLMRLVVLECVGFKRTEEDCGFLAIRGTVVSRTPHTLTSVHLQTYLQDKICLF